jgi:hypothetical protein
VWWSVAPAEWQPEQFPDQWWALLLPSWILCTWLCITLFNAGLMLYVQPQTCSWRVYSDKHGADAGIDMDPRESSKKQFDT